MVDERENAIEFLNGQDVATVTLSKKRLQNRIREYAKKYPDEVQIIHENEDGTLLVHMPVNYIRLQRPSHREISEEERKELSERLRKVRYNKNGKA